MVAVCTKNTLASLNALMSDEERHSSHDRFRPIARGFNAKSSCFVGNICWLLVSGQPICGGIELAARLLTRVQYLCFMGGKEASDMTPARVTTTANAAVNNWTWQQGVHDNSSERRFAVQQDYF